MSTFKEVFLKNTKKSSIVKKDSHFDKAGYTEEDYFVVTVDDRSQFRKGCIVKLKTDDNSRVPAFILVSGMKKGDDNWDYVSLDDLVKLI